MLVDAPICARVQVSVSSNDFFTVGVRDEVANRGLRSLIPGSENCSLQSLIVMPAPDIFNSVTWEIFDERNSVALTPVQFGELRRNSPARSSRLSRAGGGLPFMPNRSPDVQTQPCDEILHWSNFARAAPIPTPISSINTTDLKLSLRCSRHQASRAALCACVMKGETEA